jgi:tetratricopeptide (TPR) repeat protein
MLRRLGLVAAALGVLLLAGNVLAQDTFDDSVVDGVVISRFDDLSRPGELLFERILEGLDAVGQPYILADEDLRSVEDSVALGDSTNAIATLDGFEDSSGNIGMVLTWSTRGAQETLDLEDAVAEDVLEERLTLTADMDPSFVGNYLRGNIAYILDDNETAEEYLAAAYEGLPRGQEAESEAIQLFVTYGALTNVLGQYEKTLEVIQVAKEIDPDFAYSYFVEARALRNLDDINGALEAIDQAIALDDDSASYWSEKGRIYIVAGDYDLAVEPYETALDIDPNSAVARVGLGDIAYFSGDIAGSIPEFEKAIEDDPTYSYAYYSLAYSHYDLDEPEQAIEVLLQVLDFDPEYLDAIQLLGDSYYLAGDRQQAAETYQSFLDKGGVEQDYIIERINEVN